MGTHRGYSGYSQRVLGVLTEGTRGTHRGYSGYSRGTQDASTDNLRLALLFRTAKKRLLADLVADLAARLRDLLASSVPMAAAAPDAPMSTAS